MEALIDRLGVRVRYEEGDFKGGLCRINGERMIIAQKKASLEEKIESLARSVGRLDIANVYVVPELRELIERYRAGGARFQFDDE